MEKNKNPEAKKRSAGKGGLIRVIGPYRLTVIVLVLMALAGSAVNLVIPRIIARGIDTYTAGNFDLRSVVYSFLAAALGIFIFTLIQGILQTIAAERVARDLRTRVADKISRQSYAYILKSDPARFLTNLTSDMDSVKMFVSQAFVNIISSLFVIIGAAVLLISINWKLALAVLLIVPIIAVTFLMVFRRVKVLFRKSREVIDALNRIISESILGSALIRVLNSQQPESQKFLEKNIVSRDIGLDIVRLFSVLIPVVMFVSNLAVVIILALGGRYVVAGTLSLGNFAAFNTYLAMLIFPIIMIGFMSNIIASASASYGRISQVLDDHPTEETGKLETGLKGDIRLEEVSLSYGEKPVLKKVSFTIAEGSRTAIIGPTAGGKSQLLYLLSRLISPSEGRIAINGVAIEDYTAGVFHEQLGLVFQDSVLFNISLRENIAFSDSVSEASLRKAIETAELGEFIESLPEKLDTVVSERGTSLSGGQKQRIMLARALALEPRILLLDDFTSRVDRQTENLILCNLERNYPDLTLISVSHKIAPIRHFDQIILLMEGEVIATGTHSDLLEHSPEYMQIYSSQHTTHHYEL